MNAELRELDEIEQELCLLPEIYPGQWSILAEAWWYASTWPPYASLVVGYQLLPGANGNVSRLVGAIDSERSTTPTAGAPVIVPSCTLARALIRQPRETEAAFARRVSLAAADRLATRMWPVETRARRRPLVVRRTVDAVYDALVVAAGRLGYRVETAGTTSLDAENATISVADDTPLSRANELAHQLTHLVLDLACGADDETETVAQIVGALVTTSPPAVSLAPSPLARATAVASRIRHLVDGTGNA